MSSANLNRIRALLRKHKGLFKLAGKRLRQRCVDALAAKRAEYEAADLDRPREFSSPWHRKAALSAVAASAARHLQHCRIVAIDRSRRKHVRRLVFRAIASHGPPLTMLEGVRLILRKLREEYDADWKRNQRPLRRLRVDEWREVALVILVTEDGDFDPRAIGLEIDDWGGWWQPGGSIFDDRAGTAFMAQYHKPNHDLFQGWLAQEVAARLEAYHARSARKRETRSARESSTKLTNRQTEVLAFYQQGMSDEDIAKRLRLDRTTIRQHRRVAMKKLGILGARLPPKTQRSPKDRRGQDRVERDDAPPAHLE